MSDTPIFEDFRLTPPKTAEELIPLPTAEELIPLRPTFAETALDAALRLATPFVAKKTIPEYFIQGFEDYWGDRPLGLSKKDQEHLGPLLKPLTEGQSSIFRTFNKAFLEGLPAGLDAFMRLQMGVLGGVSRVAVETGLPRDIPAMIEAFPGGHLTGLPFPIFPRARLPFPISPRARRTPIDLDEAAALHILPDVEARRALAPEGVDRPTERVIERVPEEAPTVPPVEAVPEVLARPQDIHTAARLVAPDVFREYDVLAQQKEVFRLQLEEARLSDPRTIELQTTIGEILSKVRGVEERLTNSASDRLEAAREELAERLSRDTPEMTEVRRAVLEADFRMRDLAPQVSEAYREARLLLPEEVPVTVEARAVQAAAVEEAVAERVAPMIRSLAQRAESIARDTERRLIGAGRPADEARAAAALVAAHYEARAARFGGTLGTARDLYEADAPRIVGARGPQRGRTIIRDARNTIQLFERADASTFIHELGHNWLFELEHDATRPEAPEGLRVDAATVREWLGADGPLTRAQHERFARGFEHYLMEGTSPTQRLARVFEKFREWLTTIYQTVARLRAPINDEIRGVYDRLLTTALEPVVVPERDGPRSFDTIAEAAVRETPAAEAEARAGAVRLDRDAVAARLSEVVENARREARRGPQGVRLPEREGAGEGSTSVGPRTVNPDEALGEGRTPVAGKSEAPSSATAEFEPVGGPLVDKAGNIRIENLNVPEDVAAAIRAAAEESGGFLTSRRGILSDAETIDLARDLGMAAMDLDRRVIGEAFNAEQIIAARKLLVESATETRDAMVRAASGGEKELIEYALARERHMMIQEQVAGVTAEAGRALRAFRALRSEVVDAEMLGEFFQNNLRLTPEQLRAEAALGATLDTPAKINKFNRDVHKPTWKDYVMEAWYGSVLSGWKTHARNVLGNTATIGVLSPAETAIAAGISRVTGSRAVQLAEAFDRVAAIKHSAVEAVIAGGQILGDESLVAQRQLRGTRERHTQAIPGLLGQVVRIGPRFLAAEDQFFQTIARRQEREVQARIQARHEGLTGDTAASRIAELIDNPTDEIIAAERQYAEYQTFTNPLPPWMRGLQTFINQHPALQMIVPFLRTTTNMFKYSLERTPLGFAMQEVRDNVLGRNGDRARDTQMARIALGTAISIGVFYLGREGLRFVTGGGDPDPRVRETEKEPPYSVRLSETGWSYRGLEPLGSIVGLAADAAEVWNYGAGEQRQKDVEEDKDKLATLITLGIARNLFDKLSMRSLALMFQAATDPGKYGQRFINQMVSPMVPAAVAQFTTMDDPFLREARTLVDSLKGRIPFLRAELKPVRDRWGEPIPQQEIGPITVLPVDHDPINAELKRLHVAPGRPDRHINEIKLTPDQYDDYARISGRLAKNMLDGMMLRPDWSRIPDGIKKKIIAGTIEQARSMARASVVRDSMGSDNDLVVKGVEKKKEQLH